MQTRCHFIRIWVQYLEPIIGNIHRNYRVIRKVTKAEGFTRVRLSDAEPGPLYQEGAKGVRFCEWGVHGCQVLGCDRVIPCPAWETAYLQVLHGLNVALYW